MSPLISQTPSLIIRSFICIAMLLVGCSAYADMPVNVYDQGQTVITLSKNQPTFIIKLKSNPTTGYSWKLTDYNKAALTSVTHRYVPPNTKLIGAPGFEVWTFRATPAAFTTARDSEIKFDYIRPWQPAVSAAQAEFVVTAK